MSRRGSALYCVAAMASLAAAASTSTLERDPSPEHHPPLGECLFPARPHVVLDESSTLLQYWLVADAPHLREPTLPASESLRAFRQGIGAAFDTLPLPLLEDQLADTKGGDERNVRLVLAGAAGVLRPMTCLEALLLSTQTERAARQGRPMYTHPTEFLSYVLARGDSLKVWYYTVDQPGVGGVARLHEPLERDLGAGWSVLTVIHNHNFFPMADAAGDPLLGGVAPSVTDVQYLRSMRGSLDLPRAAITNGFHSVELLAEDFDRLSAR